LKFESNSTKVYDRWADDAEYAASFRTMIATHNEKYNPSGNSFKPKRAAEESAATSVEARAVPLPVASVTKEALTSKGNLVVVLGSQPHFELLVQGGGLWLHGLADGVVSDQVALCGLGDYKFHLGSDATKYLTDSESLSCHFKITDDQFMSVFGVAEGHTMREVCPSAPMTLHSFMSFLERNSQVDTCIANHKVERQAAESGNGWTYKVEPEGDCVGTIVQKFGTTKKAAKPAWANVGALLDGKKVRDSPHAKVFIKMT